MSWRLLVVRKDSPIRMFNVAMQRSTHNLNIFNSSYLKTVKFDKFIIDHHGAYHVDVDQLSGLMQALIKTSLEHPGYFSKLGDKYLKLGSEWLQWLRDLNKKKFSSFTNKELCDAFDKFCQFYVDYAPILFVPFAVERRYVSEYPKLLEKIAEQVERKYKSYVSKDPVLKFIDRELLPDSSNRSGLINNIKQILEHSGRKTLAEEKDFALNQLATLIRDNNKVQRLFSETKSPKIEDIRVQNLKLSMKFEKVLEEYGWIAQWGYPPLYKASTIDNIIEEVKQKIDSEHLKEVASIRKKEKRRESNYKMLLRMVELSPSEKELINDLNLYNFLRTYRMELKIKAQYLSVPLLKEIEKRGTERNLLKFNDIFFMLPPEISEFFKTGKTPNNLTERRKTWALVVNNCDYKFITGKEYENFALEFYTVVDYRVNGRSIQAITNDFVGGKALNLFRLIQSGFNVPKYFVITTKAYTNFIDQNNMDSKLQSIIRNIKSENIKSASEQIRKFFTEAKIDETILKAINEMRRELDLKEVTLRSSATVEDSEKLSWAGRFDTFLYISEQNLADGIKKIWASLYSPIAIQYALENQIDLTEMSMAIVVQEMIEPDISGIINTTLSVNKPNFMEIEAAFGQGEPIVKGEITPDNYLISKEDLSVFKKSISKQTKSFTQAGWTGVSSRKQKIQKLSETKIRKLAEIARNIEISFERPQDIEYAIKGEDIWIVQTRPETGLNMQQNMKQVEENSEGDLLLVGQKGKVETTLRGVAKVLTSINEGEKLNKGDILVTHATTPAWDPIILKSSAIITNEGGSTSHTIRVANERSLPAVVGVGNATNVVKDCDVLIIDTRDPFKGKVYKIDE